MEEETTRKHRHRHHTHHSKHRHNSKARAEGRESRHSSSAYYGRGEERGDSKGSAPDSGDNVNERSLDLESSYRDSLYSGQPRESLYEGLNSSNIQFSKGGSDGRRGSGGGEGRESAQVRDSFSPARESYRESYTGRESLYGVGGGARENYVTSSRGGKRDDGMDIRARRESTEDRRSEDRRLASPDRKSPRNAPAAAGKKHSWDIKEGENTFAAVTRNSRRERTSKDRREDAPEDRRRERGTLEGDRRTGEDRRSDGERRGEDRRSDGERRGTERRGPEAARNPSFRGGVDTSQFRNYRGLEPGRPGSGLAAAAALVGIQKPKVPPPVPQKPDKTRMSKVSIDDSWTNNFPDYAGSEVADQDSLDGLSSHPVPPPPNSRHARQPSTRQPTTRQAHPSLPAVPSSNQEEKKSPAPPTELRQPSPAPDTKKSGVWNRRKESDLSSESDAEGSGPATPPAPASSKPAMKSTMDRQTRAQSDFSGKSAAMSKISKSSRVTSSRPQGAPSAKKRTEMGLNPFSGVLWDRREPFKQLWITLSAMYGKMLVLLMIAFCLIEVMDNKIKPLTFQAYFMMYLYIGSIIAIMCIYITVLLDNCPSVSNSRENLTTAGDPEVGSIGSIGTLKRAHISRNKVSRTSFYLRIGALVFGLGTLIFNGLEIAMHATMNNKNCVDNVVIAHPILQALFTFLQMHFLFVNSTVIVERFGLFARFGFIHLVATNLSLWVRTIIWESASEWIHHVYTRSLETLPTTTSGVIKVPDSPLAFRDDLAFRDRSIGDIGNYDFTDDAASFQLGLKGTCNSSFPVSTEHVTQVISLYACFNDNTLGRLWTSSMPYLFPFIVEYSLIAAAVTYVMWRSVGQDKMHKLEGKKLDEEESDHKKRKYWRVDCQSASKGLFLGLLCLVGGIIILIIFFVMKDNPEFKGQMFWIYSGAEILILSLCAIASLAGFVQIQKLSHSFTSPYDLDDLLSTMTLTGSYIFAIFSILAAIMSINQLTSMVVFSQNALLLVQVTLQGMIMSEAGRRVCMTRSQQLAKPGRQIITFLLFANITLWILDTFMSHRHITQSVQTEFYGLLAWGILSRISLPLLIFYRFHSCVVLVEIWKNTYRTKESL